MLKSAIFAAFVGVLSAASSMANAVPVAERYARACAACHNTGAANAPKKGDQAAWAPRLKQGDAVLLAHVKNGFKAMPPKGLCNDCTDAEFKALITYMSK